MSEPVVWADDGSPHSPRFNDRYRSRSGGVAQALHVFLAGCGLPERWRDMAEFTVLETGFGLGINFLTTWAAWEADERRCDRLHFVSIEAYPVAAADIVRSALVTDCARGENTALAPLSARLQALAQQLARAWRGLSPGGVQHLRFADGRVQLTLAVGEVETMLAALTCKANAVYLDGFSPAVNPQMWSRATLQAVARHCRPGTTLATYTVAHSVREALEQLGFRVEKQPGLPPKRQRLQAEFSMIDSVSGLPPGMTS
ncbi:MAG: tRNA (5-methylaminomethyl-2-thiouridine)(34)-methyltransferase MnmD [Rhodoferax sp.]